MQSITLTMEVIRTADKSTGCISAAIMRGDRKARYKYCLDGLDKDDVRAVEEEARQTGESFQVVADRIRNKQTKLTQHEEV